MSSEIKVSSVKAKDGTAGISIADSTGRVSFTETNPVITLGTNTTFPTKLTDRTDWYYLMKSGSSPGNSGNALATNDTAGGYARMSGVAPTGFTSITSAYIWFRTALGSTNTYTANIEWQIGSSSNNYKQHSLSSTALFSQASGPDIIWRKSITGIGSSPNRFEDLIAADDYFGIMINTNSSHDVRQIGIEITWRF